MGKKSGMPNRPSRGGGALPQPVNVEKGPPASATSNSNLANEVIDSDHSRVIAYDPRQKSGPLGSSSGPSGAFDEVLKATPPALLTFLSNLPTVEGPSPNVDIILSICLQSEIPAAAPSAGVGKGRKGGGSHQATSDLSGSTKSFKHQWDNRQSRKRKDFGRQEEEKSSTVQSQPAPPRDVFRLQQIRKASRIGAVAGASQTGSTSYGSAFSGDISGSTG